MSASDFGRFAWARSFVLVLFFCFLSGTAVAERITLFAAASLQNVLADVAGAWSAHSGQQVVIVPAGSSALARQIQQGAPADIFISANVAWMDVLERDGLIRDGSRVNLLGNRLVLVASAIKQEPFELSAETDLIGMLNGERLAMALVDAVPAGIYGKAALRKLGLWQAVRPHVAQTDNVRAALALVATGEVPLGIVYATDVQAGRVGVVATFPGESHGPIIYPAALVADSRNETAGRLLDFLKSPEAAGIFIRHGFQVVN